MILYVEIFEEKGNCLLKSVNTIVFLNQKIKKSEEIMTTTLESTKFPMLEDLVSLNQNKKFDYI